MSVKLDKQQRIHLVGIGGSGMNGIAEVLLNQGFTVSGSDQGLGPVIDRLTALGAHIFPEHSAANTVDSDIVVYSSAIAFDNPELVRARELSIPLLARAEILSLLMDAYFGIAVAGTHGKTTTTSLVASILGQGGMDPTFVIGGLLKSAGTHAKLGQGRYFVAEADESDASFLHLNPRLTVITNIDADHLSAYGNDYRRLQDAFVTFCRGMPERAPKVVCIDDPGVAEIRHELDGHVITYGFSPEADLQAVNYRQEALHAKFTVVDHRVKQEWPVVLNLAGRHNVQNALAGWAVARELEVAVEDIVQALKAFEGVGRRFQIIGELPIQQGRVLLVDDYGHHPSEVAATLSAARQVWPNRRIVMAYQPHRYTRTQDLWQDFIDVLSEPDQLVLVDIYSAGEPPIAGVSSENLIQAMVAQQQGPTPVFVAEVAQLPHALSQILQDQDIVFIQGAGSIGKVAQALAGDHSSLM